MPQFTVMCAACGTLIERHAPVAGVRPLPDISRHVGKTVFVDAERLRLASQLLSNRRDSIPFHIVQASVSKDRHFHRP